MEDEFYKALYEIVRPIVLKLRSQYQLRLWTSDDWDQEGMIALFELVSSNKELVEDSRRLGVYFKTKFSNRVKDALRKQESQKRRFDRMRYDEISEVSHMVSSRGLDVGELVAFNEALEGLFSELSEEERS